MENSATGVANQGLFDDQPVLSFERQLPPELWQDIFQLTIFGYGQPFPPCPREPWIISGVCRHWRSIALSTPALWSRIILKFSEIFGQRREINPVLKYIQILLHRSANAPISLSCEIGRPAWEHGPAHAFFDLLFPTSDRWEMLYIRGAGVKTIEAFGRIRGHLSILRVLSLSVVNDGREFHSDLFCQAPRLEAVGQFGSPNIHFTLPLRQISVLKTTYISNVIHALVDGSNLTELYVSSFSAENTGTILDRALPSLVRLEITFVDTEDSFWDSREFKGFFDKLTFPSLRSLSLSSPPEGYHRALTQMASQFSAPWPLESLIVKFTEDEMKPGELHSLLSLCPQLTLLEIDYPTLDDLVHLIATPGKPTFLPHLEEIDFYVNVFHLGHEALNDVEEIPLVRLLRSRSHPTAEGRVALKSFTLEFSTSALSFDALGILHQHFSRHNSLSAKTQNKFSLQQCFRWRDTLRAAFPLWDIRSQEAVFEELDKDVFSTIEREEFEAPVLFLTGLHLEWHRLSLLPWLQNPRFQKFSFGSRARDLMRKWSPSLYEHIQHIYWQPCEGRCLKYVPDNSPLRFRENYMEMIYGETWNDHGPQQDFTRRRGHPKRDCSDWDKL
ncbi:hypothetical protein CPB83DRAFT_905567 [Crepidotus variabilis]|uniref:F-box domain-containing protein n=1 Tax=Crepidotus variabilis TaxID=179855 RepID=A0A9P6JQS2_9AGAR|nr:hypothetical protein CPB83DRAFT_905567 [Crepidotus variabilis]